MVVLSINLRSKFSKFGSFSIGLIISNIKVSLLSFDKSMRNKRNRLEELFINLLNKKE